MDRRKISATAEHLLRFVNNVLRVRMLKRERVLPQLAVYHVNYRCNAACSFCSREDDIAAKVDEEGIVSWNRIESVFREMRKLAPAIYFSGGEPLLDPRIEDMLGLAGDRGFYPVAVNTNAILLDRRLRVPRLADITVVSIHAADPGRAATIFRVHQPLAERALRNVVEAASTARAHGNRVVANCVITPSNIKDDVLDFCLKHGIPLSIVPVIKEHMPAIGLAGMHLRNAYIAFIERVIRQKRTDPFSIQCSFAFLEKIRALGTFDCRPTSIVSVDPDGNIINPCGFKYAHLPRIIGRVEESRYVFRKAPGTSTLFAHCQKNCLKACYAEPALAVESPIRALLEHIPASLI
jgi:MoaA/NifB/PqqE/SkfB family radical SAM enzyme